jgi:hypothetical protein
MLELSAHFNYNKDLNIIKNTLNQKCASCVCTNFVLNNLRSDESLAI